VNAERCALLGSAYKRLASLLDNWSAQGSAEHPNGIREALEQSVQWYKLGEGDLQLPNFSVYNCQNRLALQAVLGVISPADAQLAIRAGKIAAGRYLQSRDYFDVVMEADGQLIACLLDGSLQQPNTAAVEQAIVTHYRNVREKLPETLRWSDSVLSQIALLAGFYEAQGTDRAAVARSLRRIHAMLAGTVGAGASDDASARATEPTEIAADAPHENVDRPAAATEKRRRGGRAAQRVTPAAKRGS
jgi:hypothetical protein